MVCGNENLQLKVKYIYGGMIMSNMRLVRCVEERQANPEQISKGKLYWIDDNTRYKDADGDEYGRNLS